MGLINIGALRARQNTLRTELVEVPEWGGQVMLRELNGAQRVDMMEDVIDLYNILQASASPSGADIRKAFQYAAKVVALTWVDEAGNLVVAADDEELLTQQSMSVIFDLATKALQLSRMTPGATEEAKKNSSLALTLGSGTT